MHQVFHVGVIGVQVGEIGDESDHLMKYSGYGAEECGACDRSCRWDTQPPESERETALSGRLAVEEHAQRWARAIPGMQHVGSAVDTSGSEGFLIGDREHPPPPVQVSDTRLSDIGPGQEVRT